MVDKLTIHPVLKTPQWDHEVWKGITHRGCLVTKSADQAIATATETTATWDQNEYDTNGLHSTTTNTSRITVPTGITKVILRANVQIESNSTGYRYLFIRKNGAGGTQGAPVVAVPAINGLATYLYVSTPVLVVTGGDYFEVRVFQTSGGNLNLTASSQTWFEMQIIG